jgi:hypothetical protein
MDYSLGETAPEKPIYFNVIPILLSILRNNHNALFVPIIHRILAEGLLEIDFYVSNNQWEN